MAMLCFCSIASAQVDVFVDFTSDTHDGAGGAPNGFPDWVDELDKLALATGITPFTPAERSGIETDIMMQLGTMYAGYDISFSIVPGPSPHDSIYFGKDNTAFGSLGTAPRDPGNIASGPMQTAVIAPANFTTILDEFSGTTMRPAQMSQIATALAGSGAHELGHSLGLAHHSAYGDPAIHPGTYADTGGIQNTHIMATGSPGFLTGISETERETPRTFSAWSKAMFDITGGAAGKIGGEHFSMVSSPIPLDTTEEDSTDAPPGTVGAMGITMTSGESSGMLLGFVSGNPDLPSPATDIDVWSFDVPSAGFLSAEIFSTERFGPSGYDTILTLMDPGGAPMAMVDDVFYLDDTYGSGPSEQTDPFLLNIPLASAGTYYLKVTPKSGVSGPGEAYWMLVGFQPIPEPSAAAFALPALAASALKRRRRLPSIAA